MTTTNQPFITVHTYVPQTWPISNLLENKYKILRFAHVNPNALGTRDKYVIYLTFGAN